MSVIPTTSYSIDNVENAKQVCNPINIVKVKPDLLEDDEPVSRSWVPILGYNSTYRVFAGGGYFYKNYTFQFGTNGIITQDKTVKWELSLKNTITKKWSYTFGHELAHGFEPYYGEGSQTRAQDRVDIVFWRLLEKIQFDYLITPNFTVGPVVDFRSRRNKPMPEPAASQITPREDSVGGGFTQSLDFRNLPDSPTFGWVENFTTLYATDTTQKNSKFIIYDMNLRFFQQITKETVFAVQMAAGTTTGTPSYLFTNRLGGTDRLRGYYDNRFRGRTYYLEQTEIRFPIWKMIGGVYFLEFGEATNSHYGSPSPSTGVGLRVGLPPDYLAKIRLDIGFGKDQHGIFLDFGQSF